MADSKAPDYSGRLVAQNRRLAELEAENRRLRNLLKVTGSVEPSPEQSVLVPHDPGVVTNDSPTAVKVAVYLREFAARQDVYAYYWENQRKGTRNWSPKLRDQYGKGPIWERGPLPLTTDVIAAHLNPNFDLPRTGKWGSLGLWTDPFPGVQVEESGQSNARVKTSPILAGLRLTVITGPVRPVG